MIKKFFTKLQAVLANEKGKKNSPLSFIPEAVIDEAMNRAEEVVDVVDKAAVNLVAEAKKEVENVTKVAKKTSSKKKPAATKKKSTPKKSSGGGGGSDQQVV